MRLQGVAGAALPLALKEGGYGAALFGDVETIVHDFPPLWQTLSRKGQGCLLTRMEAALRSGAKDASIRERSGGVGRPANADLQDSLLSSDSTYF